jgi:salicylate hydroxylase
MRGDTGEQVGYQLYGKTMEKECGAPLLTVHRADLHNMLVTLVQSSEKVKIRLNSRVKSVDADSPSATLESGEVVHGDLIIGADGIRSYIRDVVLGEPTSVIPTGTAIYRGLISASRVLADPDLRSIIEKPELCAWRGSGRSLITYPVVCYGHVFISLEDTS